MSLLAVIRSVLIITTMGLSIAHAQSTTDTGRMGISETNKSVSTVGAATDKKWDEISSKLEAIQKLVDKDTKKFDPAALVAALFGLVGVLVGGLINARIQGKVMGQQMQLANDAAETAKQLAAEKATQERVLAENRAKLEIGNSFVQWQLKQLSELYGPLHALLNQSNAIYRQMNEVLCNCDSQRFRMNSDPGELDNKGFEINIDNSGWTHFRTVLHLAQVYGKNYGVEDYFDEVIAIGGRMVKIIEEKAGYTRPEQSELSSVFGSYLAHYAVLAKLHAILKLQNQPGDARKSEIESRGFPLKVMESAVFPRKIQGLVKEGFVALNGELMEWRARTAG